MTTTTTTNGPTLPAQVEQRTFSLVPSSIEEGMRIAKLLSQSQLVPKDYQGRPENCFVAIAWGQELGLAPLQSLQNIAVINGRPALWGDAALAIAQAHPAFEDIDEVWDEAKKVASCTIKRVGRSPVVRTFSFDDAKRAGLLSKAGPWTQYPGRMAQLRARGFALRDAFPDALRGFKTAEEAQDIEELDVTPTATAARPGVTMPKASPEFDAMMAEAGVAEAEFEEVPQDVETLMTQQEPQRQQRQQRQQQTEQADSPAPVEGVATLSAGMLKVARAKLQAAGADEAELLKAFRVDRLEAVPMDQMNSVLDWIKGRV